MYSVLLNCAGEVNKVSVEHGNEGRMMLSSQIAKGLVEGLDVVRSVVGWKSDAGEEDLDVRIFKGG